ncbi:MULTISPECIES: flavin reductase family protein [unclassified Streptomyces]|uniref:flavin reductase family protein n=1 Tax=unclassified Streptomyces TaxID=2593676 RepID=UPI00068CDC1B|nr:MULTISPECIES: flavin reductase family protein [unclassified Streptomyces]
MAASAHSTEAASDEDFRAAMAHLPTFVTVITTMSEQGPVGCTANALLSLSAQPPSLLVSLAQTSRTAGHIRRSGAFVVNALAQGQEELCRHFSAGDAKTRFDSVAHTLRHGQPVLTGAAVTVMCAVESVQPVRDHLLFVGRVLSSAYDEERQPVVYHGHRLLPVPTVQTAGL